MILKEIIEKWELELKIDRNLMHKAAKRNDKPTVDLLYSAIKQTKEFIRDLKKLK